jgi:hypothetical protein
MNCSKWILSLVLALTAMRAEAQPRRVQPGSPSTNIIRRAFPEAGIPGGLPGFGVMGGPGVAPRPPIPGIPNTGPLGGGPGIGGGFQDGWPPGLQPNEPRLVVENNPPLRLEPKDLNRALLPDNLQQVHEITHFDFKTDLVRGLVTAKWLGLLVALLTLLGRIFLPPPGASKGSQGGRRPSTGLPLGADGKGGVWIR